MGRGSSRRGLRKVTAAFFAYECFVPAEAGFSTHITVVEYCVSVYVSDAETPHADPKSERSGDPHEFYGAGTALGDVSHRFKTGHQMK